RMEDPVQARAVEDVVVRVERVVTGGEHHETAEQEREDDGRHRHRDPACALAEGDPRGEGAGLRSLLGRLDQIVPGLAHAGALRPTPTISKPICSSETAPVCSPTISPS